jgi:hypothetical protein
MPDDCSEPRALRLWDLRENQAVVVKCCCGRIAQFGPGVLQRLYRVPSDTLVYDLRFRLRCSRCNAKRGFEVTVVEPLAGRPAE